MLCAALSLLAKPMWVTLPLLLLVLDHWPLRRRGWVSVRRAVELAPLLVLSIASSAVTLHAQGGAVEVASSIAIGPRILNAIAAPIRYLRLTVWPDDLSVIYPHPYLPGGDPPTAFAWLGIGVAWLVIVWIAWAARDRGYVVAGLAWFLIALVPVIGIVQVGEQAIADRYTYVPLIGIFALIVFAVRDAVATRGLPTKALVAGLASVALILLAIRSVEQVGAWRDTVTLYERSLAATPNGALLHFNLGNRLLDQGHEERAVSHFEAARRLRPDWAAPTTNLAWLLATTNDPALLDPERAIGLALEASSGEGADANALDTLAAAHASAGDFERAEVIARRAVALSEAANRFQDARIFDERRRLYERGERYEEPIRSDEVAPSARESR